MCDQPGNEGAFTRGEEQPPLVEFELDCSIDDVDPFIYLTTSSACDRKAVGSVRSNADAALAFTVK